MEIKRIGIGVVLRDERVLVGVRDSSQVLGGMHEFPGGKCELDESPEDCTIRECLEETGLQIAIRQQLYHTVHEYPHGCVELFFFECAPLEENEEQLQGNFQWVPRSTLAEMNFPEANLPVVNLLLGMS